MMGDRANVYVIDSEDAGNGIYLYTHWSGYKWPEALRQALDFGRGRWGDESYLTRIVISPMFSDLVNSETGGGVRTRMCDNSYPILVLDHSTRTVAFAPEGSEANRKAWYDSKTFEQFCAEPASWPGYDED